MARKHRSSRRKLTYLATIPFGTLLLFGVLNYNMAAPEDTLTYGSSNLLLSAIRASFYFSAGILFMLNFKKNLLWLGRRLELMAFVIFALASVTWTEYPDRWMMSSLHFIGGLLVAYIAAIYFTQRGNQEKTYNFIAYVFGIFSIGSLLSSFFLPQFGTQYIEYEDVTRWRGLTINANLLGVASLVAIWSAFAAILNTVEKRQRIIYGVFILVAFTNLWFTQSRTSQITLFGIIVVMLMVRYLSGETNSSTRKRVITAVYGLTLVGIVIGLLFSEFFITENFFKTVGKDSSVSGRDTLWQDAFTTFLERPLIGWSFDGRATAYDYIMQDVTHYHNGYLDVMVRGGAIGTLLFFVFLAKHFYLVTKMLHVKTEFYGPVLAFSLGILVYNMTEVTFANFDNIYWVLILFLYFLTERDIRKLRIKHRQRRSKFVDKPKFQKKKVIPESMDLT